MEEYREILMSNLIMIAEIPTSKKTGTTQKAEFIAQRLSEYENSDVSIDEIGNVVSLMSGTNSNKNIALVSHMDTIHDDTIDHTIQIQQHSAIGTGLVDNSLGIATLLTLPHILKDMGISINSDLICCFSANQLQTNDLRGTQFFLEKITHPIDYGICVEGYPFGRVSYQSLGSIKQKLTVSIPEEYDWSRLGQANAIININHIINAILEIPIPSRPKTSIILNEIKSKQSLASPTKVSLSFEIRSESNTLVQELQKKIEGIIHENRMQYGVSIDIQTMSKRQRGGLEYMHPLVQSLISILEQLEVSYRTTPSSSDLSAFIDKKIPALTLGLTQCEHYNTEQEIMDIDTCYKGIAQLLALILEIDKKDFSYE